MKRLLIYCLLMVGAFTQLKAQSFLNGGFENNTAGVDRINITNAAFNGFMANTTGFGTWSGVGNLDIVRTTSYGLGPQSGTWYIALTGGGTDRVAMELSSSLVAGNTYTLNYYDNQWSTFTSPPVRVGISNSPTFLGTFVFMGGAPISTAWTLKTQTFVAPVSGNFITIETDGAASGGVWTKVDNFFLSVPLPLQSVALGAEQISGTNEVVVRAHLQPDGTPLTYWLERSVDGQAFDSMREVFPAQNDNGELVFAENDRLVSQSHQEYRLKVVDANGQVHYTAPIQVDAHHSEPEFLLFPNPSNGLVSLYYRHPLVSDDVSIQVYDLQGKLVTQKALDRTFAEQQLDLTGMDPGLYLVNIVSGGFRQCARLVLE